MHALVRAVPGSGKTTTLVGRVTRLCELGASPRRIRVVMFNRAIEEFFRARLDELGLHDVRVSTFDSLGLEVLRVAQEQRRLQRELQVVVSGTEDWARAVHKRFRDQIEDEDELVDAISFWKAHLISPTRAACRSNPALVEAYKEFEARRLDGEVLRVAFADMVYTAVRVLKEHPRLLGPIDHFLIDEFQDVNLARVTLLQRLSAASTEIMAVGDEDQAINEWCGAHPRFFRDFAANFAWLRTREYPLPHSFRFGPGLAVAASRLIGHNQDREHIQISGAGPGDGALVETGDIVRTLAALDAEGVRRNESAVLYRGRGQGAGVIARLAAARVPVETDDFERLRKSRAAALTLGYLRFATSDARPSMHESWKIVYHPDRFITKELFERQLALGGARGLAAVLADRGVAREVGQRQIAVDAMAELAETLRLMGRCTAAGEALKILRQRVDVEAQLTAVLPSERQREQSLVTFDAFVEFLRGLNVSPADSAQAVASFDPTFGAPPEQRLWVSTIHKAKGKEWRCVLLPALAEGLCPTEQRGVVPGTLDAPEGVEQSPWIEQERRIFYVAITRASERVYLQGLEPKPSRFLREIMPAPPPVPPRRRRRAKNVDARPPEATTVESARPRSHGKSWTDAEKRALAEAWAAGGTLETLGEQFGRSAVAIAHRVVQLGLVQDVDAAMSRSSGGDPPS